MPGLQAGACVAARQLHDGCKNNSYNQRISHPTAKYCRASARPSHGWVGGKIRRVISGDPPKLWSGSEKFELHHNIIGAGCESPRPMPCSEGFPTGHLPAALFSRSGYSLLYAWRVCPGRALSQPVTLAQICRCIASDTTVPTDDISQKFADTSRATG